MSQHWFSALLRFVLIVEGEGATTYFKSVFTFRADDWTVAKERAVQLAQTHEEAYRNADGKRVVLKLMGVETLDMLSQSDLDGCEVYSEHEPAGKEERGWTIEKVLQPLDSRPTQTGVG